MDIGLAVCMPLVVIGLAVCMPLVVTSGWGIPLVVLGLAEVYHYWL